jgi:FG-GAP repeat
VRRFTIALALVTATVGVSGSAQLAMASTSSKTRISSPASTARSVGAVVRSARPNHLEHNGDFDGNGWMDLAAGSPEDDVQGKVDSGTVNVLYGSPSGVRLKGNQQWTEAKTGLTDLGKGDFFGRSAATGDFNNDGFDDLAIAAIRRRVGTANHAGAVYVLYGSALGLRVTGAQYFDGNSPGMPGNGAGNGDLFGGALHGADWNNDGYTDLAVGVWCDTINGIICTGSLTVLPGGPSGLTTTGAQYFDSATPGMQGTGLGENNQFARQVCDADFNGDGFLDMAIGDRQQVVNGHVGAGALNVLYGSATGLTLTGNQFFTEDSPGMAGNGASDDDWFGRPVTQATFNNDAYDDLLIGARQETVNGLTGAGAAFVMYGSAAGLSTTGSQEFDQGSPGMPGPGLTADNNWGHQAGAGDFNGDGYTDVGVNAIDEPVNGFKQAGTMTVMYGGASGLSTAGATYWTQATQGIPGDVVDYGWFGFYMWSKDFNGDGFDDMAVSAPGDTVNGLTTAGIVIILNGSASGIVTNQAKSFDQSQLQGNGAGMHDLFGGIEA